MRATHRNNLSAAVVESLREAILVGDLRAGDRLVETELARRFNTSRGPIREAIASLNQEGLVVTVPRSGSFVAEITPADFRQLCEARVLIEGAAIEKSVVLMTEERFARLDALVEAMARAGEARDTARLIALDLEFHRLLVEWSAQKYLIRFMATLNAQTAAYISASTLRFNDHEHLASRHHALVEQIREAYRKGSTEIARRALTEHIEWALQRSEHQAT